MIFGSSRKATITSILTEAMKEYNLKRGTSVLVALVMRVIFPFLKMTRLLSDGRFMNDSEHEVYVPGVPSVLVVLVV
jgi:hypothetical protein